MQMTTESTMLTDNAEAAVAAVAPIVGGSELQSMGLSMLLVVGVIVLLGWLYSRSRFVGSGTGDIINVIASRALGPKERLLVVEVADQQLLVGMTSTAVQTLHVFEKPISVNSASEDAPEDAPGFKDRLRNAIREIGR